MGIVSAEELYNYLTGPAESELAKQIRLGNINQAASCDYYDNPEAMLPASFTMEHVEKFLDVYHTGIAEGKFPAWKTLRPWGIVDMSAKLDENKPWIGWEIETGWNNSAARNRVMAKFLNENHHVAVDNEGPEYGAELTWAPANNGEYEGKHPLLFVCDVAAGEGENRYEHEAFEHVGTHVNVSTPSSRKLNDVQMDSVANALNLALVDEFSFDDFENVFGRGEMYGGFFDQRKWIEGKLFNTTYDADEAKGYMLVAKRLAGAIETLASYVLNSDDPRAQKECLLRAHNLLGCLAVGAAVTPSFDDRYRYAEPDSLSTYDYDDDYDDECDCDDCVAHREEYSW